MVQRNDYVCALFIYIKRLDILLKNVYRENFMTKITVQFFLTAEHIDIIEKSTTVVKGKIF